MPFALHRLSRYHCKVVKRCLLVTIVLPFIAGIPYNELAWSRSLVYISCTTSLAIYSLLLNFPSIVRRVHSRPLYYNDLEDDTYVDPAIRMRFQYLFIIILQITLSFIASILIYYYYDKMHTSTLSGIEMVGVLGGFVSLLLKLENFIGKIVLSTLNMWKLQITNSSDISVHEKNIRRMRTNSLAVFGAV